MPKLHRLDGQTLLKILQGFGFELIRVRGSHHILRRVVTWVDEDGVEHEDIQTINIPIHGKKNIAPGLLKRLYRDSLLYIPEDDLKPHFYTD